MGIRRRRQERKFRDALQGDAAAGRGEATAVVSNLEMKIGCFQNRGVSLKMDGENNGIFPLKWMIWGENPPL